MAMINSVLGPLDTDLLGFTLSHEHVMPSTPGILDVYPELVDRSGTTTRAVAELRTAHSEGLRTIVDLTTFDLGRDALLLKEVSRQSGVNIIACTGTWLDIPRSFAASTPDRIAPLYIREIQEGIEKTGIRAGIIKVANDQGGVNGPRTPRGEIILRAAARAQKATGVPISTHTYAPERVGEQQVRIFEEEGVDLNRVYIGHSNDTTDTDYLIGLLRRGVWIGMDRYPGGAGGATPNWERRTETVKKLLDAGWGHRVMLSHDWINNNSPEAQRQRQLTNPDGYLFITHKVLPLLRKLGATDQDTHKLMVENPRRFFAGER